MKTRHPLVARIASLLSLGIVLASANAGAQTLFFSNSGSGSNAAAGGVTSTGSLADIGFDLSSWNRSGSVNGDTGSVTARPDPAGPGLAYDINVVAAGLSAFAPAGTTLDSVTFYFYAEVVNPDGSPVSFSLYDGYQSNLGNFIAPLSVSSASENNFFSFTVTAAQLAGGFSITADGLPSNAQLNLSTELNPDGAFTPGVSATYAVPEPSGFLLALIGTLPLLRRRRL